MAINKNHEFEELNGIKCGIAARQVSAERAEFLKDLLLYNRYEVVVVPVELKAKPAAASAETDIVVEAASAPELYTVGVTDYTFNPINAIFGRLLRAPNGKVVTLAYWNQEDSVSRDEVPYFNA